MENLGLGDAQSFWIFHHIDAGKTFNPTQLHQVMEQYALKVGNTSIEAVAGAIQLACQEDPWFNNTITRQARKSVSWSFFVVMTIQ